MLKDIPGTELCPLVDDHKFPILVQAEDRQTDLLEWARANRENIIGMIRDCAAVLLRNFNLKDRSTFTEFVQLISQPQIYNYRSTPRNNLGNNLYTASEYPPAHTIPLHCENAYQRDWPMRLFFYCEQPAAVGGETPLACVNTITHELHSDIKNEFIKKKIMYVRNYHPGLDLPWQTVFQTDSRNEVECYCEANGIACEWIDGNQLRTRQICGAVAKHPDTKELLWFNQAHLFHVTSLDEKTRNALLTVYSEEQLPRNALYGDGTPIEHEYLQHIHNTFNENKIFFEWQKGDILILDNMLVAHGRNPYCGDRNVLVMMGDSYSSWAVDKQSDED